MSVKAGQAQDVYRSLPEDERFAIASAAAEPGTMWLGDRAAPDEHAAMQPVYASQLVAALARRGHLLGGDELLSRPRTLPGTEPWEAELARRGRGARRGSAHTRHRSGPRGVCG